MPDSPTDDESGLTTDSVSGSENKDAGNEGANNADSPAAAADGNKTGDTLSAVRSALGIGKETSSSSEGKTDPAEQDKAAASDPAKAEEEDDDSDLGPVTPDELKGYHSRTRRRVKGLIRETEALNAKVEKLTPLAEKAERIEKFVQDNGLTPTDLDATFEILRLMRSDPARAYEMLTPIYEALAGMAGDLLPADLMADVKAGKITAEYAKDLARLRSGADFTKRRTEEEQERGREEEQRRLQDEAKRLSTEAGQAVTAWERKWQQSDPDYPLKQARVNERIELELLRLATEKKMPRTTQEAVEIAERCRKAVDEELKKLIPKRQPMKSVTGVAAATGSKPVPQNTREAIMQVIGR